MPRTAGRDGEINRTTSKEPINKSDRGQKLDAAGAASIPPPATSAPPPPPPSSGAKSKG